MLRLLLTLLTGWLAFSAVLGLVFGRLMVARRADDF